MQTISRVLLARSVLLIVINLLTWGGRSAEPFIWLEGENPTSIDFQLKPETTGHPEFLSGQKWLKISIEADAVNSQMPGEGILITYAFKAGEAGEYELWNRIGYEFVRSPFEWRVDAGQWSSVSSEELTTDLMELSFWTEVAWFKLGKVSLSAGDHKLEIRLSKRLKGDGKDKGKPDRVLYASDALVFSRGQFHPYSHYKPGQDHRTAEDRKAEKQVYGVPEPRSAAERTSVKLAGIWEVTRHDEQLPMDVATPITDFPASPRWTAIEVPGDKNTQRPDLLFAHRLWYRTRVNVPASLTGRSFFMVFPQNNLNTTVYVNGQYCGFDKNPFARVQIDVSKGMKPGMNEIWVGIKDAWYGYSQNPDKPLKLRKKFNLPLRYLSEGFQDFAYPIWNHPQSGMLVAPELVAAGGVYASDVFCAPSVAKKELALEISLNNPTRAETTGQLFCEAVNLKNRTVEKKFAPKPFALASGKQETLRILESWPNAQLWWPDAPTLYAMRVTVKTDNTTDSSETTFGFREWTSEGPHFKLNGIKYRHWADCFTASSPTEWLDFYRNSQQTTMRFWGTKWQGLSPEEALQFFDRNGVVVRRSGMLDGQAIGNMAIENDPDLQKLYGSKIKIELMKNWQDQMVAQVKGERNHPSVNIWSLENEWLYINCINLYGGMMDEFESAVGKVSDSVRAVDPTRFTMTDGGGANKDQSMPIHGNHYVFQSGEPEVYPPRAYEANPNGGGRGRWVWDLQRPRFIGEDYFANGINPFDYAYFGGEVTFQGKAQAHPAAGVIYRMLMQGYRWAEYGGWQFWMGQHEAKDQYAFNAPRVAMCREWDWTFAGGQQVPRSIGIFNDTRFAAPIEFTWLLSVDGKEIEKHSSRHQVPPGENEKFVIAVAMPEVSSRREGEFTMLLKVEGKEVFRRTENVSLLPAVQRVELKTKVEALALFDPHAQIAALLRKWQVPFTACTNLARIPEAARVLLIGPDALNASEATSSRLSAWASAGNRLLVLDQTNPLKYQALPAEMNAQSNTGCTVFIEDASHPVLQGLQDKDFFAWNADGVVYRNAYEKPTRGGKSLLQCHRRLKNSALVEVPVGEGLMMLCQLQIGAKVSTNVVAQTLLVNLLNHVTHYKQEFRTVVVAASDSPQFMKAVETIGLEHTKTIDALTAISGKDQKIAVIHASPANLKQLAANSSMVQSFLNSGGYIVLNGLTPEGLADYNRVVGFEHMIRPFSRERVSLAMPRHPLTAGLTSGDVVMRSGERIFGWTSDEFVANDVFSYIVDYRDVAPFAKFEDDFKKLIVNGMLSADAWKYIVNLPVTQCVFKLVLPKAQTIESMTWVGNTFYWPATQVQFAFDGKEQVNFDLQPNSDPQELIMNAPQTAQDITFKITKWNEVEKKNAISGLDNINIYAKRPPEFLASVKPLLNIGGMMFYEKGKGGIVLMNLLFKESEAVPENALKKRAILSTVLRNLKAPFSGGRAVIAGAKLNYSPVDISKHCTQFRNEKGWFGDAKFTFAALPSGKQTFAGVPFEIFDFETSPVPTVIMLGGKVPNNPPEEVRGIPLNRKADALFFLHTARIDQRMNNDDVKKGKRYEMARYLVTYSDGQVADIPVYSEIDIHNYKQTEPTAIPGAQIAWTRKWEGTGQTGVAYLMQWNNPRPGVELKSLDFVYGKERRGVPVLLGLTAAQPE